jgi:hypothetical protein
MAKLSDVMKPAHRSEPHEPPVAAVDKPPYNPREFLVPATNSKSRTPPERMQFKCQVGHAHEVGKIIAQRLFPYYETPSDLLRHALDRHLKYLHGVGAPVTQEWLQTEAIIELMKEQNRNESFNKFLDDLEDTAQKLLTVGMRGEAKLLVNKIRIIVGQMSPGRWCDRWNRELTTRFGQLSREEGDE